MTIQYASAGIAASVGAATAVIQSSSSGSAVNTSLIVPLFSALIGGAMSYAVLRTTVSRMERDVRDIRRDMSEMYSLLRQALTQIAHLEGRIGRGE
jgi:Flp pilus assembly protein TadG